MATRRENFLKFLKNNKDKLVSVGAKFMQKAAMEKEQNPNVAQVLVVIAGVLREAVSVIEKLEEQVRGY